MIIPNNFCPASFAKRNVADRVTSTAEAFKSWDTCMDNTACKIIAIVLIVLGGLVVMWALTTIIRCMCMGFSCLEAMCCCCCRSASKDYNEKQHAYNNPNMYGPAAQPAYYPVERPNYRPQSQFQSQPYERAMAPDSNPHDSYYQPSQYGYANTGYEPVDSSDYNEPKDPFNEHRTAYRGTNW